MRIGLCVSLLALFAIPIPIAAGQQAPPPAAPIGQPAPTPPPAPKVAPTGVPTHSVDLMASDGVTVFGGQWRVMDAQIVEAPPRPNAGRWKVSYDLRPKAG